MNRNEPFASEPTRNNPSARFQLAALFDVSTPLSYGQPSLAVCFAKPVAQDVETRFSRCIKLLANKQSLRALTSLEELSQDDSLSNEAGSLSLGLQGVIWFTLGDWDRAERLAKQALERWENQLDAYAVLFAVALSRGDEPLTLTQAHCFVFLHQKWLSHQDGPTRWFSLTASRAWFVELTLARSLAHEGDSEKARSWLSQAEEHGLEDPHYYLVAALDAIRRGEPESGRALLLRGSATFIKNPLFALWALKVLDHHDDLDEADQFVQQWGKQSKGKSRTDVFYEQVEMKLKRQQGRAAFRVLMGLPEKEHESLSWQFLAGKAMEQMGDGLAAEQYFRQVLAEKPDHDEAAMLLANLHKRRGGLRDALELLSQTLSAQQDHPVPVLWVFLALHKRWLEDEDEAWIEPIQRLSVDLGLEPLRLATQCTQEHFRQEWLTRLRVLSKGLLSKNEDVATMLLLRLMLELKFSYHGIWKDLGSLSLRLDQPELAAQYLERAAREEPGGAEIWGRLGLLYEAMGLEDNAELCRRKVEALRPDSQSMTLKGPTVH